MIMKTFVALLFAVATTACGTVGGAGTDLQKAGEWIKSK